MVFIFWPWVWEEDIGGAEGVWREGVEELLSVAVEESQIVGGIFGELVEAVGESVLVDFGAEESDIWLGSGLGEEVFAGTEADFEDEGFLCGEVVEGIAVGIIVYGNGVSFET